MIVVILFAVIRLSWPQGIADYQGSESITIEVISVISGAPSNCRILYIIYQSQMSIPCLLVNYSFSQRWLTLNFCWIFPTAILGYVWQNVIHLPDTLYLFAVNMTKVAVKKRWLVSQCLVSFEKKQDPQLRCSFSIFANFLQCGFTSWPQQLWGGTVNRPHHHHHHHQLLVYYYYYYYSSCCCCFFFLLILVILGCLPGMLYYKC